jgi:hypothetical protein
MKTTLTILFTLILFRAYSQDTLKVKQVDALVLQINSSTLPIQRDTLIQDYPEIGLKMTIYLTMIVSEGELIKYVNYVNSTRVEKGVTQEMTGSNTFYYDHNKLIKVEEYLLEGDKKITFDWYYSNDKALYYTLKSDKAEDRATLLLSMSKTMLKQIIK